MNERPLFQLKTGRFSIILYSMNYKSIYTSPRFDDEDEEKKQKMPFQTDFLRHDRLFLLAK